MLGTTKDAPRIAQVFLSSTFNDLQNERSALTSEGFRRIRKIANDQGIQFNQFLDLRWGILEKQINCGKLLDLCLKSAEVCRPFFMGIKGKCRGTAADKSLVKKLANQKWKKSDIQSALDNDYSVTEVEFWHALKVRTDIINQISFFKYSGSTTFAEPIEEILLDLPKGSVNNFKSSRDLVNKAVKTLEQQLTSCFPVLDQVIVTPATILAAPHNQFASLRLIGYIPDVNTTHEILRYLDTRSKQYIYITAESGTGKSSQIAYIAREIERIRVKSPIFMHFCSLDRISSVFDNLLSRLISEMAIYLEQIDEWSALKTDDKIKKLPYLLEQTGQKAIANGSCAIFLIDGLDQLEHKTSSLFSPLNLKAWLPERPPSGTFIVISQRSEKKNSPHKTSFDYSDDINFKSIKVRDLNKIKQNELLVKTLYPKVLFSGLKKLVLESKLSKYPLFIKSVAEELKLETDRSAVSLKIQHLSTCDDFEELYYKILDRMAFDYNTIFNYPTRNSEFNILLGLLLESRLGLKDIDIISLMGSHNINGTIDDPTLWNVATTILDSYITNKGGYYGFVHEEFRDAIKKRLNKNQRKNSQDLLADYFFRKWNEKKSCDDSQIDLELPWHLLDRNRNQQFIQYLSNPATMISRGTVSFSESCNLYNKAFNKITNFWDEYSDSLITAFDQSIISERLKRQSLLHLAKVLNVINRNIEAITVSDYALTLKSSYFKRDLCLLAGDAARELCDYKKSRKYYSSVKSIKSIKKTDHIMNSSADFGLARIHRLSGQHDIALSHYTSAFVTIRDLTHKIPERASLLPWRLFGLGEILRLKARELNQVEYNDSLSKYNESKVHFERVNDIRGLAYSYWGIGEIHLMKGNLSKALSFYQKSRDLCLQINDTRSQGWAQLGESEVYRHRFYSSNIIIEYDKAINVLQETAKLFKKNPTERSHLNLQLAECYRKATFVFNQSLYKKAKRLYSNCIKYYSDNEMIYCVNLAKAGLKLLNDKSCDLLKLTFP